jgi:hypothetical protein
MILVKRPEKLWRQGLDIDTLHERCTIGAPLLFGALGGFPPTWALSIADGMGMVMVSPWKNGNERNDDLDEIRQLMRAMDVACYNVTFETWIRRVPEGAPLPRFDPGAPTEGEAVAVMTADRRGNKRMSRYMINRDDDKVWLDGREDITAGLGGDLLNMLDQLN